MASKKTDKTSLQSRTLSAILGTAKPVEEEQPQSAPVEPIQPQGRGVAETEAAPVEQPVRKVGRPAAKTPKRSYGVSLSTDDYDALREMSKGADTTITEMLEVIIREYDANHPDLREKYRKIQALLNS